MRACEFMFEDGESTSSPFSDDNAYSEVVMILGQIQHEIKDKDLDLNVPTQMVIDYIKNAGVPTFSYEDLLDANDKAPAIKEMIKNISPDKIEFSSGAEAKVSNPDNTGGVGGVNPNPEQTVSSMANAAAAKRRQD